MISVSGIMPSKARRTGGVTLFDAVARVDGRQEYVVTAAERPIQAALNAALDDMDDATDSAWRIVGKGGREVLRGGSARHFANAKIRVRRQQRDHLLVEEAK